MVSRVYVEKKPGFDVEARSLARELREVLGIERLERLRLFNRYLVEGIDEDLFAACVPTVFSEPQSDDTYDIIRGECVDAAAVFAVEPLPGQFDQRADSAAECVQLISQGERPVVQAAKVYLLYGDVTPEDVARIKAYCINPVESREADLRIPDTLAQDFPTPPDVEVIKGFTSWGDAQLEAFIAERGLACDLADLRFCRDYFASEQRDPTITEIKMIDTYWSDHCRHTTFGTVLDDVAIDDATVQAAFERYLAMREELGRSEKPVCLMDMGTIGAKWLKSKGQLTGLDESDEINACTVKVKVDVDGKDEDWLFLFKNETHNHPTEIEPFGGAATCVGGAIRDPLSGRSYVYQAMRVTGAADPTVPVDQTIPGKLPQRKIVTTAAAGYSSYGNQIGLATGQVSELYHPGYAAKRMEIGAVLGATPAAHVRREEPAPGDVVVLLGGRTGRDGIGGATGSSKAHDASSVTTCGAEVQKGNAPVERKIQRLFRRGEACRLIKRCNDFGAGGVSVAIGELADGLSINLDCVLKKYDGLDGTELAISESQERMAVALAPTDVEEFLEYARQENLEAVPIATVTAAPRVRMTWRGRTIVDVSREFLASNGAPKHQRVRVTAPDAAPAQVDAPTEGATYAERLRAIVSDLNVCGKKGLVERFDSTIGAGTVLMPFGGARQLTPALAMACKLPVFGQTNTASGMAWGFNPYVSAADPFTGAYLAVVESVAKYVGAGFPRAGAYLTLQEYFPKLRTSPERWGMPTAAVLGALMAQVDLGVGAIGGKDSMSGSFEELDVPPTLVSFCAGVGDARRVVSPELKAAGDRVVLLAPVYEPGTMRPQAASQLAVLDAVEALIAAGQARAVSTCGFGGSAAELFEMCLGNRLGIDFDKIADPEQLFVRAYGSFMVELAPDSPLPEASELVYVEEIGTVTADYTWKLGGEEIALDALEETWASKLEDVFPYRKQGEQVRAIGSSDHAPLTFNYLEAPGSPEEVSGGEADECDSPAADPSGLRAAPRSAQGASAPSDSAQASAGAPFVRTAQPKVIIPVSPGNNCEYDSAAAFERAGAVAQTFIVNNLSPTAVAQSTRELAAAIRSSQILMIPGGFSGGDEPDGSAKFITAFFRAPEVTDAVRELLDNDGLILGICNGFQALVKLGLVPFGDIRPMDDACPTLTFNEVGRHQSRMVRTRVASTLSPWLSRCEVGDVHTVPISHGEGRFVASPELLAQMEAAGQIATQYCDEAGVPSMDWDVNPNGSVWAIEGITSPDGRILGKMGHTERTAAGLYVNIPDQSLQPIFEGGVGYFTE